MYTQRKQLTFSELPSKCCLLTGGRLCRWRSWMYRSILFPRTS